MAAYRRCSGGCGRAGAVAVCGCRAIGGSTAALIVRLVGVALLCTAIAGAAPVELREGDVVAFIGGTDMVRMQKDGRLEAAMTYRSHESTPKFRDLAWEGDTVFFQGTVRERWRRQAFGGWPEQLDRVGATLVIAQFGKIESLGGAARLGEFVEAYSELLDQLAGEGRRIVLLGPSHFEWEFVDAAALPDYALAVEALAARRGLRFIPDDPGSVDPAIGFARALAGEEAVRGPNEDLRAAVRAKHALWYDYWRPANWKCLFGDDSRRIFSNAAEGLPSLQEEWATFPKLIEDAEARIASGEAWIPRPHAARTGSAEADVAGELSSFEVLEGFEVNLFADESHGIANPLSVRWDARGRMFVACSDVYPQIEPGTLPDDKIISLWDTDGDGRADGSVVFADGLNIPTGMEAGPDGVYVGQGTELLTLRDTDGDGVADERMVLLSGFGNGDSHQTINSFVWSPGGELWFCQGDGIESRVETPTGVSSLFQAGVFRLRPRGLQLDGLLDDLMGPGNPWGVAFDDFGQSFVVDGAGGISYLTPASIPVKRRRKLPRIGDPGGYCGVECLGASTLPAEMQGEFVLGDYKKNQVSRFAAVEDGAGFKVAWREPLLRSRHRNFRPIDVKVGPDGAIYIVDWYNPITCHQDDFYRHPARDKTHGRIWRVARRGSRLNPPALMDQPTGRLLDALGAPERWTRMKAKQVLAARGAAEVVPVLREWVQSRGGRDLMEAVALLESLDAPDLALVESLLASPDYRVRAYGARVVGRWGARLENPQQLLQIAATDPSPRVRMEAALASAAIPDRRSVLIAAAVAEAPRDRWIDYAFSQAVHHLKPHWLPAFRRGDLDFGDHMQGLAAVLGQADSKALLAEVRGLLGSGRVEGDSRLALARTLVAIGEEDDLRLILELEVPGAALLDALAGRERPGFDVASPLLRVLERGDPEARAAAMRLLGHWRIIELRGRALAVAGTPGSDPALRSAAIGALGKLGGDAAREQLESVVANGSDPQQAAAVAALLGIDLQSGSGSAALLLATCQQQEVIRDVFVAIVAREGAGRLLVESLGALQVGRPQGELLRGVWVGTGLVDAGVALLLDRLAGVTAGEPEFSDRLVGELVSLGGGGDRAKGEVLFRSAKASCTACHKVGEQGGAIGPDLSAVGSGVPPDRIVTEVLWPARQVKEGYALNRVTVRGGVVVQGYVQESRLEDRLLLRDFASGKVHEINRGDITSHEQLGSLMPPVAQTLTKGELGDLLAYLFALRGQDGGR